MHGNGGDSVQINSGNVALADVARYIYIGRNIMHEEGENAVDLKQCADVVVSQNLMCKFRASTDLAVAGVSQNSLTLTWTVPGESGVTGTPIGYDIRYASSPITEANWAAATQVQGEPIAGTLGQPQSFAITNFTPGTTYPTAVKVLDEAGHVSELSNVVSATTSTGGNHAPVLAVIGNQHVDEGQLLTFTARATDSDIPANVLTFSLLNAPAGASLNPAAGVFLWTPTEGRGQASCNVTVRVTDNATPNLSDEEAITITVIDLNEPLFAL